jgi:hypothetical protein
MVFALDTVKRKLNNVYCNLHYTGQFIQTATQATHVVAAVPPRSSAVRI